MPTNTLNASVEPDVITLIDGTQYIVDNGEQWTLLVFYPGDFTLVCTRQWCAYRDEASTFEDHAITLIGVTAGPSVRHSEFSQSYQLPFKFAQDTDSALAKQFNMMGRFGNIKRGLALIDPQGVLRYIKSNTLPLTYPAVQDIIDIFVML